MLIVTFVALALVGGPVWTITGLVLAVSLIAAAFVGVGSSDAFHPKAVRTSMGSLFKIPVLGSPAIDVLLEELEALGAGTLGAVASGGTPLPRVELGRGTTAVFLGSEAFGLPWKVTSVLVQVVTIPMASEVTPSR